MARFSLLNGVADLMMLILIAWALQDGSKNSWMWAIIGGLVIGFASAVPWFIFPICYLGIVEITQRFKSRIWQSPILAMMIITAIGTILLLVTEFIALQIMGINLKFSESLTRTILPSMLLNLLFAFPIYVLIREINKLIYPVKNE